MSRLILEQIAPGATLQDQGRPGFARFGLTGGGALDRYALAEGQALLGNAAQAAALELPGFGGRFRAEGDLNLALSGAEMAASLNGAPLTWRRSFSLRSGDVLTIGAAREGVYGYLHVEGGFQSPPQLGSRSTHLRAGLCLLPKAGGSLSTGPQTRALSPKRLPRPDYFNRPTLRILPGPQTGLFPAEVFEAFLADEFTVTDKRDRMGIRLMPGQGPLKSVTGLSIASDAINLGDIQITGDGTPAILLADRGSSGGYPRIAALASVDLDAAAQMPVGHKFRLQLVSRAEAVAALAAQAAEIKALPARLGNLSRDPRDIADLLSYNLVDGMISAKETR